MPLPRFRLRSLMIAVAVAATAFWGYRLYQRQGRFRAMARKHQHELRLAAPVALNKALQLIEDGSGVTEPRLASMVAALRRKTAYHAAMRDKYRQAARRPWLPVPPDPPPPK